MEHGTLLDGFNPGSLPNWLRAFLVWSCRIRCLDTLFWRARTSTEFISNSIRAALRFCWRSLRDWPHRGLRRFPTRFGHVWPVNRSCPQKSFSSIWDNFGGSPLSAVTCPFASSSLHSSAHREQSSIFALSDRKSVV